MARGAIAKENITKQILNTFEGSFINEKEIRIPYVENGEEVEIKVTLTCAKDNVRGSASAVNEPVSAWTTTEPAAPLQVTEEEKKNVKKLLEALNL